MRLLIILFLSLCCLSCDQFIIPAQETTKTSQIATVTEQKAKKEEAIKSKREFPLLTSDNAMDFFKDFEKEHKENKVRIMTDFGNIDILLYNTTKYHRANFIFLTKQGYFDDTQFYRIVENFIIQGGSTDDSKVIKKRKKIGKYLLPKDIKPNLRHVRGTISMPSKDIDNPHKMASPYQFFIVQKKDGAHHLNGDYTVFGKVIKGMHVVDEISKQPTDNSEWPIHNVYIRKVEILD